MTDGIVDTSTFIALDTIGAESLPERLLITTVTLAELSVGPVVAGSSEERGRRLAHLQVAESDYDALPFDKAAARAFGRVAGSLRRAGRTVHARRFDALIAAIALAQDLPVYTCNPDDFRHMDGLQVVAVPLV